MMKSFTLILLSILLTLVAFGQQDALYTQHQFNKLPVNPAYAGSREAISAVAMYRRQWVSFPGAPKTLTFGVHAPLSNKRVALGFQAISDEHGITSECGVSAQFAYRIPTREGKLSMGFTGGLTNYRVKLTTAESAVDFDPSLMQDVNRFLPNIGFGVYYYTERWFAGASAPELVENSLTELDGGSEAGAHQYRHYYAMGGLVVDLNRTLKLRPTALVRYVANAPVQADLGASILFHEKLWVGAQYRTLGSVDFTVEYRVGEVLRLGYAYDQQLGSIGMNSFGSHEVMVGIDLQTKKTRRPKRSSVKCFYF